MTFNRQDKYPYRKSFKLKSAQGARMDSITSKEKFNRNSLYLILGFSLFELLLHLYTNAFAGYGYFRDELYYTACSNHPAAGYVDQPPLSAYILFISIKVFGKSLFALRFLPAIVSAITVFIIGLITRKLNGRYTAITLACIAVALAPIFLGTGTFYSMNIFDWLFWALAYYIVILIINSFQTGTEVDKKLWIWLGIVLGLGLLNKISLLWFGAGLLIGLILTPQRKYLRTPWPYFAGIIAFVIFSPYIIWNITHNFATLEFIHNASALKYSSQNPGTFINDTFQSLNPVSSILWIAGIFFLFFHREGKVYRLAGYIFLIVFIILIINFHSKAEYISPAFPILYAAGAVMVEKITLHKGFGWIRFALPSLLALSGLIIAPLALPVLPVEQYIKYSKALGKRPSSQESQKLEELPQFYADMFGWENMAATVSKVYTSLPPEEQKEAVVFGQNYGEAGAIDFFRGKYPLPPAVSAHNNYWFWGYGDTTRKILIVIGSNVKDNLQWFDSVRQVGEIKSNYAMPYETNIIITICQKPKYPYNFFWHKLKFFI
jgi:hypothetical protein